MLLSSASTPSCLQMDSRYCAINEQVLAQTAAKQTHLPSWHGWPIRQPPRRAQAVLPPQTQLPLISCKPLTHLLMAGVISVSATPMRDMYVVGCV